MMITSAGISDFFNTGVYSFIPTICAAKIPASAVGGIKSPSAAINDIAEPVMIWFLAKKTIRKGTPNTEDAPNDETAPNKGIVIAIAI